MRRTHGTFTAKFSSLILRTAPGLVLCCVSLGFLVGGCTAPARDGEPVVQSFALDDEASADQLWEVIVEVLRDHNFDLERVDRRAGVITTVPHTSEHFFEFWRNDVATTYDWFEASATTIRRRAIVHAGLPGGAPGGALSASDARVRAGDVEVVVEREEFSTPERQFNNSMAAFQMFGEGLPAEATGRLVTRADGYWVDAGRDLAMEHRILSEIALAMGEAPPSAPDMTRPPTGAAVPPQEAGEPSAPPEQQVELVRPVRPEASTPTPTPTPTRETTPVPAGPDIEQVPVRELPPDGDREAGEDVEYITIEDVD